MTTYVGSATGVSTATMPAHQVGDLIIVKAFRDASGVGTATFQAGAGGSGNSAPATLRVIKA